MTIAGNAKLEAVRSAFLSIGQEVFSGQREALNAAFCRTVPCDGEYLEIDAMGAVPAVQEIVGSRRWGSLRAYVNRARVRRYGPDGLEIPIIRIQNDKAGLVAQQLADYVRDNASFWEKPITDFLISNPTCLDGGALLSTTHSYGVSGGTWSNKTTNALSPSEFFTGISTMEALQLENGEPAGYYPDTLMVGPSNRKMALDLCSGDRVVPVAATGLEAYASAVAAATRSNFLTNGNTAIKVIVQPRFIGSYATDWLLLDTRREQARPIIIGEAMAPQTISVVNPESDGMVDRSVARFYAEGQAALLGGAPFSIYGLLA